MTAYSRTNSKMKRGILWKWELLIVFKVIGLSMQVEYEFELEDEEIYSNCSEVLPGTLNIKGLFDMTNLRTVMTSEGIEMSGNMTCVFNAQPSDRIELTGSLFYFDRGIWLPTTLNMVIKDFCHVMFDDKQLWYRAWSSRITNRDVIKRDCIKVQGTLIIMDSYTIKLRFGTGIPLLPTRHALRVRVFAIDLSTGQKRPHDVCYEIRGNFYKI
ncbi:uncharacterized protein LOC108036212 [Drosophila biarmipes]|uniref:uncharacterized protein LOC108036212 n=1 Tax=Drosophila biarmipes TaxID=125945 RepID=UPI0007E6BD61|nr:uncharacterized protein LOC108036212 [Drosophila biarmipes]